MLEIRECLPDDYQGVAIVCSLTRPEPFTAEELMEEDRRYRLTGTLHRLAAIQGGEVVGYGYAEYAPWFPEGRWQVYAVSHPAYRGQGVGTALYQAVEQIARDNGATGLVAWCSSEDPGNFAWAEKQGFLSDLLRTEAVLDLPGWDGARFQDAIDRVTSHGIQLEVHHTPEPEHIIFGTYEVERLTGPDVPDYEPDSTFPTYEDYRKQWLECTDPRVTVVALDGDRVVGQTTLFYSNQTARGAYTGYTGVLREYRGKGIALALKVLCINEAAKRNVPHMRTNNDFENPPMLAVNKKLGYRLVPGPRRIKKSL